MALWRRLPLSSHASSLRFKQSPQILTQAAPAFEDDPRAEVERGGNASAVSCQDIIAGRGQVDCDAVYESKCLDSKP